MVAVAQWSSGRGDPALGETFRSPSKFTRGLNPTPSFSPKAETLALPWWSRSQGTRSHVTPRRARCYPVSARYSRVAVLCLPMRVSESGAGCQCATVTQGSTVTEEEELEEEFIRIQRIL